MRKKYPGEAQPSPGCEIEILTISVNQTLLNSRI